MCKICTQLKIPEYLHQRERVADSQFDETEKIYRRFSVDGEIEDWKNTRAISAQIFRLSEDGDSCSRSKYTKVPEDVLYNDKVEDEGHHYNHHGIFSFMVDKLVRIGPVYQNEIKRTFIIKLEHTPKECLYPHSDIVVYEVGKDGSVNINEPPRSTKTLIRNSLLDIIDIYKYPKTE